MFSLLVPATRFEDLDQLVEHVTLLPGELASQRNKSGPTRLGLSES